MGVHFNPLSVGEGRVYQRMGPIDPSHKSHDASVKYPTMHHFVTEMCTHVHICVTKYCILGYGPGAFWDLWDAFMGPYRPFGVRHISAQIDHHCTYWCPNGARTSAFTVLTENLEEIMLMSCQEKIISVAKTNLIMKLFFHFIFIFKSHV